jgi:hypothetical protein
MNHEVEKNIRGVRLEQRGQVFNLVFYHNGKRWDVGEVPELRVGDQIRVTFERINKPGVGTPDLLTTVDLVRDDDADEPLEFRPRKMDA